MRKRRTFKPQHTPERQAALHEYWRKPTPEEEAEIMHQRAYQQAEDKRRAYEKLVSSYGTLWNKQQKEKDNG